MRCVQNFIEMVKPLLKYSNLFCQDGGRPSFWFCGTHFRTTHKDYLVVAVCKMRTKLVAFNASSMILCLQCIVTISAALRFAY